MSGSAGTAVAPVRAGILVTGTEVLTGIISDRNGPWLSERLRGLGVDAAMIQIVGDRPEDLIRALRSMASDGLQLIVVQLVRRTAGLIQPPRPGAGYYQHRHRSEDKRDHEQRPQLGCQLAHSATRLPVPTIASVAPRASNRLSTSSGKRLRPPRLGPAHRMVSEALCTG